MTKRLVALPATALLGAGLLIPASLPTAEAAPPQNCKSTTLRDIPKGHPDYAPRLDRDGDGFACDSSTYGPGVSLRDWKPAPPTAKPTTSATAKPTKSTDPSSSKAAKPESKGLAKTGV